MVNAAAFAYKSVAIFHYSLLPTAYCLLPLQNSSACPSSIALTISLARPRVMRVCCSSAARSSFSTTRMAVASERSMRRTRNCTTCGSTSTWRSANSFEMTPASKQVVRLAYLDGRRRLEARGEVRQRHAPGRWKAPRRHQQMRAGGAHRVGRVEQAGLVETAAVGIVDEERSARPLQPRRRSRCRVDRPRLLPTFPARSRPDAIFRSRPVRPARPAATASPASGRSARPPRHWPR